MWDGEISRDLLRRSPNNTIFRHRNISGGYSGVCVQCIVRDDDENDGKLLQVS